MKSYIVGQDGTDFMVLEENGETYRVLAHCPSRGAAEAIVTAFNLSAANQDERISYNGR